MTPNICITFLFLLLSLICFVQPASICPLSTQNDLLIDSISIGIDVSNKIVLNTSVDVKCFNYTIINPFSSLPQVAVALNHFQTSSGTNNLFLSIKPLAINVNDYSKLSFVLRTQWAYTNWKLIKFSFLAQQRIDTQASFYQIETGYLADCSSTGKDIQVYFPFRTIFNSIPSILLFLNGFEISSDMSNGYQTPFQLQQNILNKNITGVALSISVTTGTKILALIISYVAYDSRLKNVQSNVYIYQKYVPINNLNYSISSLAPRSIFHGLTGFIIGNSFNNPTTFDSLYNPTQNTFTFTILTNIQFLSYTYLTINGNLCSLCQGYSIYFANTCLSSCPANTYLSSQTCIACSNSQYWNGTTCIQLCAGGRYWNNTIGACQCPSQQIWTGSLCLACPNGQFYNSTINSCQCLSGTYWNGLNCISCIGGMTWNSLSLSCQCPIGSYWNSTYCVSCYFGQVWNQISKTCECPINLYFNGSSCISCTNGRYWNSTLQNCQCYSGSYWNGTVCLTCQSPRVWNPTTLLCECSIGTSWTGYTCISCAGGQLYNISLNSCQCPVGSNWNGNLCMTCYGGQIWNSTTNNCNCPNGYNWSSSSGVCIVSITSCPSGLVYNSSLGICQCATGSNWNGVQCVTCYGGSLWNSVLYSCYCTGGMIYLNGVCICPNNTSFNNGNCVSIINCSNGTVFNGSACVNVCAVGFYYNGTSCTSYIPSCPADMYWNLVSCVYIVQNCPSGMIWNGTFCISNSTQCPVGYYYWNGTTCLMIGQKCPFGLQWVNNMCLPVNGSCPTGTYYNGAQCVSYQSCSNNMIWNSTLVQCVCPQNSFWNGKICVTCTGGMFYDGSQCSCPSGTFYNISTLSCVQTGQSFCLTVSFASWNGTNCVCFPGYKVLNNQCICNGLQLTNWCNLCYQKPNSVYSNGICQCLDTFYQIDGSCVKVPIVNTTTSIQICSVGNYWDSQAKQCLLCSEGCLSCQDCYNCLQCSPAYNYNYQTFLCNQKCGDGLRYTLECDDGNNNNGDGCSYDCKIQLGYSCSGGSPNSKDICSSFIPNAVTLNMTGQSHLFGKIIVNIRLNYIPASLRMAQSNCSKQCERILSANITTPNIAANSIISTYIGGSSPGFSLQILFGKEPISSFTLQVGINQSLKNQYFSNIDIMNTINVNISPAYLAVIQDTDILS